MGQENTIKILLGMFALIFVASFASAAITFNPTTLSEDITSGDTSATFTFQITATEQNYTNLTWTISPSSAGSLSVSSGANAIGINETESVTATISTITQTSGTITGNITLTEGSYSANIPFTINIVEEDWKSNFCNFEQGVDNPGDIRISDISISVVEGLGEDELWAPFDNIEVEVQVENNGDDDIENIDLEWGLYDESNDQWVIEVDDVESFDLKDGDDDKFTISFNLDDNMDEDLDDLDDGDNYVFYVRATGEVDNSDNDETCDWDSQGVEIIIERDFVTLTNIDYSKEVSCNDELIIKGEVWNIGSRDQDDIMIRASIKGLSSMDETTVSEIKSFESEDIELILKIPNDAQEKTYALTLQVYDEDGNLFEGDYADNDEESILTGALTVKGCNINEGEEENAVVVSADIQSGGKAGDNLIIAATITNSGDSSEEFIINVAGSYSDWADSVKLSEDKLIVEGGESKEILMTFAVKNDAIGDKMFDIEIISGEELVLTQPVLVTIEKSGFDPSKIFGKNWYLWAIALVNLVLILIIIFVAVRISKKK